MTFLLGILTVVLVLDCLLLILLVLIQLPKKEAGAGLAFGGAATDALFGAGTGNVLTKVTKYATVAFFVLAMALSVMQSNSYHGRVSAFERDLARQGNQPLPGSAPTTPSTPATTPATALESSNAATQPLFSTNLVPPPK